MNFQQSYLYWLAGAVLLIVAVMSWQDKANPRRFTTGLFWGIYGVLFLLGDWTFSLFGDKRAVHIAVGIAVVVLALIAGFGGVKLEVTINGRSNNAKKVPVAWATAFFPGAGDPGGNGYWRADVQPYSGLTGCAVWAG